MFQRRGGGEEENKCDMKVEGMEGNRNGGLRQRRGMRGGVAWTSQTCVRMPPAYVFFFCENEHMKRSKTSLLSSNLESELDACDDFNPLEIG